MDFLGIGPLELIVVLIIALIVVGPERLPELAQSVGKTLRDLRAMSQGLTAEWQREIDSVTQIDIGKDLKQTLTRPFEEAQSEIKQVLDAPLASPSKAKPPAPGGPSSPEQSDTTDESPTSPSEATTSPPALPETSPQEQPEPVSDNVDHVDT